MKEFKKYTETISILKKQLDANMGVLNAKYKESQSIIEKEYPELKKDLMDKIKKKDIKGVKELLKDLEENGSKDTNNKSKSI